jgi:ABC-type transport system involved in Fe-S cluster assembly fused permease/ATPase subunit
MDSGSIQVLDVATGSADVETQRSIAHILETEFIAHTKTSISHRLRAVREFNILVVLGYGQIFETRPLNEPLSKEGESRRWFDGKV